MNKPPIPPQSKPEDLSNSEQPLVQHLIELRSRVIKALLAIIIVAIALAIYPGPSQLYDWLANPLVQNLPDGSKMIATSVISPFLVPIKILLLVALIIALPIVLYQMWAFIAPGLYKREKKLIIPLVIISTLLFFAGMAFCYFIVFGKVFAFIQSFAPKSILAAPDIEQYLNFVLNMFFAFGLAFEVPVIIFMLVHLGIISTAKLKAFRGYFIVIAFIVSAIITPPDVVSQLALAIPMCILYELATWLAKIFEKPKLKQ